MLSLKSIILLLAMAYLCSSSAIKRNLVERDACTTDKTEWANHCYDGAYECCWKNAILCSLAEDSGAVEQWVNHCSNSFSGGNCAYAYNQGARYEEKSAGGVSCGI
jgi:hypothetical protein